MVIIYWILLFATAWFRLGGEVRVQAEADQTDHFENLPIPVTIIITHPADQVIDEKSFLLGRDSIVATKVKDVGDASGRGDILSIYHYDIPSGQKGLYVLPPVTVDVGGKAYKSVASTYEVKAMEGGSPAPPSQPSNSPVSSEGAFLKLDNIVEGNKTLYPGQTIILGYRYSFNANIETTEENTPLFEPKDFLKVGDKIVNKKQDGDTSILEVTQRLEAKKPGTYRIGPSSIEGYVYTEDSLGRRSYSRNKLKSITPEVVLTVKPLPESDKPASFNGAIGKYTFNVKLKSSPKVTVGDEMTLEATISGTGSLESIQLPDLCCQPGMSGIFKLSDLPPVGKVEGSSKRFIIQMRPLTAAVKAIPSLEFSYFDPDGQKYVTVRSDPIPISVAELKAPQEELPAAKPAAPQEKGAWQQPMQQPPLIETEGNYPLTTQDLENRWFGSWWMLLIVPMAVALLIYQRNLKKYLASHPKEKAAPHSQVLYDQAWQEKLHTSAFYAKLYKAFFTALQERGDIPSGIESIDKLPAAGAAGDVKALLSALEEARYTGDKGVKEDQLLDQARTLFKELEARK